MARYVGTWVCSQDNTRTLRLTVKDKNGVAWGTAVSTGWTPQLSIRVAGSEVVALTATGTWNDAAESQALFPVGTYTSLYPASGFADYDCLLYMSKTNANTVLATDEQSEPFRFRLQAYA